MLNVFVKRVDCMSLDVRKPSCPNQQDRKKQQHTEDQAAFVIICQNKKDAQTSVSE